MTVQEFMAAPAPVIIGATGLEGLHQCLRMIVTTMMYSVPLDRGFAQNGSFVDAPLPHAVAQRLADLTEAIEQYEPRVKVVNLRLSNPDAKLEDIMEGRVFPIIRFQLKEGVAL